MSTLSVAVLVLASGCSLLLRENEEPADPAADASPPEIDADVSVPFLPEWQRRKLIVADEKLADIDGFVLLVGIQNDDDLADNAAPAGADIRFTEIDGTTELQHQIHAYDANDGDLLAWVRLGESRQLFMYYDNPNVGTLEPGDPFQGFAAVWHLEANVAGKGNARAYRDSTVNGHAGDDFIAAVPASGQIGNAPIFNGSDDYIVIRQAPSDPFAQGGLDNDLDDMTISAWVRRDASSNPIATIVRNGGGSDMNSGYWFAFQGPDDQLQLYISDGMDRPILESNALGANGISDEQWHHVAVVLDRQVGFDEARFYLDGKPAGVQSSPDITGQSLIGTSDLSIGANSDGTNRQWGGGLDEIMIEPTARDTLWMEATYENQLAPATFITVGAEQQAP